MTEVENRTLVSLLQKKSEEYMSLSKKVDAVFADKAFRLSCDCARLSNEIRHVSSVSFDERGSV